MVERPPNLPIPNPNRVYAVVYQLSPIRNITGILEELQSFPLWSHYINNYWLVVTPLTAQQIYEKLLPHLKDTDWVFVTEITSETQRYGNLPTAMWDWITERFGTAL